MEADTEVRRQESEVSTPIVNLGTSVITVRLPRDLHAALKDEAHARRTSLNQLCVATLSRVPLAQASTPLTLAGD
jgi:predicted HicB family RNase H-like nuclease